MIHLLLCTINNDYGSYGTNYKEVATSNNWQRQLYTYLTHNCHNLLPLRLSLRKILTYLLRIMQKTRTRNLHDPSEYGMKITEHLLTKNEK